jgi:NAD(P)-dependent dehydrogenase (short-subunit alcohol dehydrogenase family)
MFSEQCFGDTDEEVHMKRLALNFDGRTVLITGAATGIGRATALAFAAARVAVLIGDVDPRAEDKLDI